MRQAGVGRGRGRGRAKGKGDGKRQLTLTSMFGARGAQGCAALPDGHVRGWQGACWWDRLFGERWWDRSEDCGREGGGWGGWDVFGDLFEGWQFLREMLWLWGGWCFLRELRQGREGVVQAIRECAVEIGGGGGSNQLGGGVASGTCSLPGRMCGEVVRGE